MKLSRLGLMLLPFIMVGMVACASGGGSSSGGSSSSMDSGSDSGSGAMAEEPDFSNGPMIEASSNAYMRGDTVRVVAGTTVKINLRSDGAKKWSMENAPAGAKLSATGGGATFSWATSEGDIAGSPYKVTFMADNGAGRVLTIYVLRNK